MNTKTVCNRRTQAEVVIKEFDRLTLALKLRMNLCEESIKQLQGLWRAELADSLRNELIGLNHALTLIESRTQAIENEGATV